MSRYPYAPSKFAVAESPLPPYDPTATCPKCRYNEVRTTHTPASCGDPDCTSGACTPEHLARTCQRCNFQWAEAPDV